MSMPDRQKVPLGGAKPAIVLAAFGSTRPRGLSNLNDLDRALVARFPRHAVYWAFTSQIVLNKLKAAGIETVFERRVPLLSLEELYAQLRGQGVHSAVVQCVLVMPGQEQRLVYSIDPRGLAVRYGEPLLSGAGAVERVAQALSPEFGGEGTATVICGHGNERHPDYNAPLLALQTHLRAWHADVFLATVEGPPGSAAAISAVRASGATQVRFVPLMFTAGDHMENDVMGDESDSWRSQIDLPATHAAGLGSNPAIAELLAERIEVLL